MRVGSDEGCGVTVVGALLIAALLIVARVKVMDWRRMVAVVLGASLGQWIAWWLR